MKMSKKVTLLWRIAAGLLLQLSLRQGPGAGSPATLRKTGWTRTNVMEKVEKKKPKKGKRRKREGERLDLPSLRFNYQRASNFPDGMLEVGLMTVH